MEARKFLPKQRKLNQIFQHDKFSKFLNLVIKIEHYLSTFYLPHPSSSSPQRKKRRKCNFLQNTTLFSLQSLSPPCMLKLILSSLDLLLKPSVLAYVCQTCLLLNLRIQLKQRTKRKVMETEIDQPPAALSSFIFPNLLLLSRQNAERSQSF